MIDGLRDSLPVHLGRDDGNFALKRMPARVREVARALDTLGGEAQLVEIKWRVVHDRRGIPALYRSERSYFAAIQRIIYRHCPESSMYRGTPVFQRVGVGRYALDHSAYKEMRSRSRERRWHRRKGFEEQFAQCIVTLPGAAGAASVKLSNIRAVDLLASLGALIVAPVVGVSAVMAKLLPTFARLVDLLNDDETIVVRVMAEAAPPFQPIAESDVLNALNKCVTSRGHRAWSNERLRAVLSKLSDKRCVSPVPLPTPSWQLLESVLAFGSV